MVAAGVMVSLIPGIRSTWPLTKSPFFRRSSTISLRFISENTKRLEQQGHAIRRNFNHPGYQIQEEGQVDSHDYRVFLLDNTGKKISPWHDIPLHVGNGVFNFVAEISKDSNLRMELATDELYTPLKQDKIRGRIRCNMKWNYGLLPQTWEDPSSANPEVDGAFGDNDPVDVVEIGSTSAKVGEVLRVKPLATLALIDEGQLDWKIIAVSLDDPRCSLVDDVHDIEKYFPATLTAISEFFRDYKVYDGIPGNKFGLGNKPANKDYAVKVIRETNEAWTKLVTRSIPAGELSLA